MRFIPILFLIFGVSYLYSYDLTVNVKDLRNNSGNVVFSLYNKDDSLPDGELKNYYRQKISPIVSRSSEVTFSNLKDGYYAVSVLHDENKNKKIDKGFLLPVEGVGLSNFIKLDIFHKPNFKDASFILNNNKSIDIKIIYF